VVKKAPRWLMPDGDTILGFEIVKNDGDAAKRIRIRTAWKDGVSIIAAKMDTVKRRGTEGPLFKVVEVKKIHDDWLQAEYIVEPLQHWQVPRPCHERLLGWSPEYRDVACALAAGVGEADALIKKEKEEKQLRMGLRKTLRADEIELDTENITFNDIKELVVLPLAHRLNEAAVDEGVLCQLRSQIALQEAANTALRAELMGDATGASDAAGSATKALVSVEDLRARVHALAGEHFALSEQVKAKRQVKQRRTSIVAAGGGDDAALRAEIDALKAENARVKAEAARRLSESEAANAALRAEVAALKR